MREIFMSGSICGHSRGYARQGHGGARAARALVVSLTYVRVPRSMPLARAVADYQKHRVKKLKKQGGT